MTDREKLPLLQGGTTSSAPPRYNGESPPTSRARRGSYEDDSDSGYAQESRRRRGRRYSDEDDGKRRSRRGKRDSPERGHRRWPSIQKGDYQDLPRGDFQDLPRGDFQDLPRGDYQNIDPPKATENSGSKEDDTSESGPGSGLTISQPGEVQDGLKTITLFVVGLVAIGILLIYLEFILIPLIFSRFLVYVFQPFINFMIGKKKWPLCKVKTHLPRWLAVILVFLFLFVVFGILALIIYFSVKKVVDSADLYLEELDAWGDRLVEWGEQLGFTRDQVKSWFPDVDWAAYFVSAVSFVSYAVPEAFLILLFVSYMLLEYDEKQLKSSLRRDIDVKIRSYIMAQALIALASGLVHGFTLFVLGIDLAMFFGLMNFVFSWIPNIGAIIAVVLPIPVILLTPGTSWLIMVLAITIPAAYQFLSGQFVEPRILSNAVSIPALTVMIALMFWGTVWGIIGAMLSIPLTVAIKLYLEDSDHPVARFMTKLIMNIGMT